MPNKTTTDYITSLLTPRPVKTQDRKVWSVELFGIWIPFFTATNTQGVSAIPAEALGAPLRLQKDVDGTPKFSKSGRPILRVVKEVSEQVRIVKENFVAGLLGYVDRVQKAMPAEYKANVEANHKAGKPIAYKDMTDLQDYLDSLKPKVEEKAEMPEEEKVLVPA